MANYMKVLKRFLDQTKDILEFDPKGCIMVMGQWPSEWPQGEMTQPPDYFCNATPIGEEWPQCYLKKGHTGRHESIDQWWDDQNPVAMKRY